MRYVNKDCSCSEFDREERELAAKEASVSDMCTGAVATPTEFRWYKRRGGLLFGHCCVDVHLNFFSLQLESALFFQFLNYGGANSSCIFDLLVRKSVHFADFCQAAYKKRSDTWRISVILHLHCITSSSYHLMPFLLACSIPTPELVALSFPPKRSACRTLCFPVTLFARTSFCALFEFLLDASPLPR